jgi:UPF0755 protein
MKKLLSKLPVIALALLISLTGLYEWFESWIDHAGPLERETVLLIPRGTGTHDIAQKLAEAHVISNARLFDMAVWENDLIGRLKAGEYQFGMHETPRQVMEKLAAGKVLIRRVTVPEGELTVAIRKLVEAAEAMTGSWPSAPVPEGSLLPETYHYVYGDSRSEMVGRMRKAREDLLAELWPKRAGTLPITTQEQAVILASIVEAETPVPAERARVAGVYLNRLKRNMKLQADPTVAYGITRGERELERPLTLADLSRPSAWNTYTIDGLPPTPINHPGRASIAAVLQPESHDFLYFVADGKGGHVFARTYDEHLKNVAAYRATQRR